MSARDTALDDLLWPDTSLKTKADLDAQLALLRGAGATDLILCGRALAPWHVDWAIANGVKWLQEPNAPLGMLYMMNSSAIERAVTATLAQLKDAADNAELEAVRALNALAIATDARVAADVKAKVLAAFRANADFFNACTRKAS